MTSASIFTAAVAKECGILHGSGRGEFHLAANAQVMANRCRGYEAGFVISSFKHAVECIALSVATEKSTRTIRKALRYGCCTML
jgi:hydrogenase/urease accessory protein HupE